MMSPVLTARSGRVSPVQATRCGRSVCATLLLASLLGRPTAAASLRELAAQIDEPRPTARITLSEPLHLGRGLLAPQDPSSVYVLSAGAEPCGLLVAGPARFTYTVEDRFSAPVAKRNVRKASSLAMVDKGDTLEISEQIERAVVWGWEVVAGAQGVPATEEGTVSAEWVKGILESSLISPPSHSLLTARRLGVKGVVYALLEAEPEFLVLDVDPLDTRAETLYALKKLSAQYGSDRGRHALRELAAQPIGRTWWSRFPAPLVAVHEAIAVDNDRDKHLTVTTTSRLRATQGGVGLWRVRLADRAFDNGKAVAIHIPSVTIGGAPADYLRRGAELLVALPRPLAQGETIEVTVVTEGDIAIRPGGDNYWWLSTWPWYPQPEENGELATVELSVRVPAPLTPFASGSVTSRESKEGYNLLSTRLEKPMQFPVVAAGKYHIVEETRNDLTVRVASYAFKDERGSRRLMKNFFAATEFYERLFDEPYPFREVSIVEINSWGFGQAPAGIIFITKEAFNPFEELQIEWLAGISQGVNERFVHEIAHGYWAHVVKSDSDEEEWLRESFAEYSAALCLEAMRRGEFKPLLNRWKAGAGDVGTGGSILMANRLAGHEVGDFRDRFDLLYRKGPLVLHALRQQLGRDRGGEEEGDRFFFALLRSFIKNFRYKWGGTRHLVGILNQMTGKDWQPWFERYVYGTETPKVD